MGQSHVGRSPGCLAKKIALGSNRSIAASLVCSQAITIFTLEMKSLKNVDLQHGKPCLRIEPVPRWLRRPHETWAACTRSLPSLHRTGAWPDGTHLRSPDVRDHALLGRRSP